MNFIEKISQSRIKWDGQSAFSINEAIQKIDGTNHIFSSIMEEILSSPFLVQEHNNVKIDRIGLQKYWNSDCTMGSKILLTLFWGGLHNTLNFEKVFLHKMEENMKLFHKYEAGFFQRDIEKLFNDLESDKKIAGVGYAFFSKFFQFAYPHSSYVICDQWTMKAVASYLISSEQHDRLNQIFLLSIGKGGQINIGLRSKNGSVSQSYLSFIEVFKEIANELTLVMPQFKNDVRVTEEILFGWDRRIKNRLYDNPRYYYQNVLRAHLKTNTPKNVKEDNVIIPFTKHIEKIFIYKNVSYYALRLSLDNNLKIGYFNKKACLCIHSKYRHLFKDIDWQDAKKKAGRESLMFQFKSISDLIQKLESSGLEYEYCK